MATQLAEFTALMGQINPQVAKAQGNSVSTVQYNPWGAYPAGRLPFDEVASRDLPAVGTGDTPVLTFTVPSGFDGVGMWYSINFLGGGFTEGSGDIVWRILQNGTAMRNFENITSERGSLQIPRFLANLQFYGRDIISIVVNHIANVALTGQVVVTMNGYYYPTQT